VEATLRDHGDQSNDLEISYLTNDARRYHNEEVPRPAVYGHLNHLVIRRLNLCPYGTHRNFAFYIYIVLKSPICATVKARLILRLFTAIILGDEHEFVQLLTMELAPPGQLCSLTHTK
jgi:hypothetical protein